MYKRVFALTVVLALGAALPAQSRDIYGEMQSQRQTFGRGSGYSMQGMQRRANDWNSHRDRSWNQRESWGQNGGGRSAWGTSSQNNDQRSSHRMQELWNSRGDEMTQLQKRYDKMTDFSSQPLFMGGNRGAQRVGKRFGH